MTIKPPPVGSEIQSRHGDRWVKLAPHTWHKRDDNGNLDLDTVFDDTDVYGEIIATGITS